MPLDNDFSEWRSFFSFQELPTLFFEFHGSTASVEEMAQRTGEVNFFFICSRSTAPASVEELAQRTSEVHNFNITLV